MSFPPPPPPPRPPSQYPPPPGNASGGFPLPPNNNAPTRQPPPPPSNGHSSLSNGMSNMQISHPPPSNQEQHGYPPPPPAPAATPGYAPPASSFPPQTPQRFEPAPNNMYPQQQQRPPPPSLYPGPGAPMYQPQQQAPPPPPPGQYSNASQNSGYPPPPRATQPMMPHSSYPSAGFQTQPPPPGPPVQNYTGGHQPRPPRPPPPGPPLPGQQRHCIPQPPPQHQPKIDPQQMPRPPIFTRPNDNGPLPIYSPRSAASHSRISPPPPADSRYLVHDDGNASPQLIRSSMYTIPSDRSCWQKLGQVDMGVLCSPMALPSQDYIPTMGPQPEEAIGERPAVAPLDSQRIPLVQGIPNRKGAFTPPPRCRSCQAYVNPYWIMDTNTCNFCGSRNSNKDFDVVSLQKGTVDYAVDGPYIVRPSPVQPIFLYALDLTCSHLEDYVEMLEQVGIDVGRHFQQQPSHQEMLQKSQEIERAGGDGLHHTDPNAHLLRQQRPRIGLCFVASFGIVVLSRDGPAKALVMSDIKNDPFCHVPLTEWTFDLSTPEGVDQWTQHIQEDLLEGDMLTSLRKDAGKKNAYGLDGFELTCSGAALAWCADALSECGGRATWISSRRPNFGAGSIRHRNSSTQSRKIASVEDATPVQNIKNPTNVEDRFAGLFYRVLQEKCIKGRVVLDIIIHSNPQHVAHQQLELSSQGEICRATCGKLTWIAAPGMGWKEPLAEELRRPLLCFQGWDAVFKVRCSSGLRVKNFVSHPGTVMDGGGIASSPELDLSCVTPQTNLAVLLEHEIGGLPKKQPFAFVQSALLYSTLSGQRRVRVSTLALRPSASVPDIFLSFDFTAFITLFLRHAESLLRDSSSIKASNGDLNVLQRQARDDVLQRIVKLLVSYRQHTNAINSPRGQLILPERLQLLPLFGMCLLKSPMLRQSVGRRAGPGVVISPTIDERSHFALQAMMVGAASAFLLVHPNVFEIDNLADGVGEWRTPPGIESALSELSKASYHSCVELPPTVNASMTSVKDDGVYLVDNGLVIYLFFGKGVSEETKRELYHVPVSLALSAASETLSAYGKLVRRLVWQQRSFCSVGSAGSRSEFRPTFPPVISVSQGNQAHLLFEQDLMTCMVDDPSAGEKDYSEFLVKMHRLIKEEVEPSKK